MRWSCFIHSLRQLLWSRVPTSLGLVKPWECEPLFLQDLGGVPDGRTLNGYQRSSARAVSQVPSGEPAGEEISLLEEGGPAHLERAACMVKKDRGETTLLSLDGISINSPYPLYYLEALGFGIVRSFSGEPQLVELLKKIEALLSHGFDAPYPLFQKVHSARLGSLIGWSGAEVLGPLIDREWLVMEDGELEPLLRRLDASPALASSSRILICGAGVCRLGAHLASLDQVEAVCCTDLSYLGLYFGRLLVQGEGYRLPFCFRSPRVVLVVDSRAKALRSREWECRFHSTPEIAREKLRYEVADAFGLRPPLEVDLVVIPYLLDIFAGSRMVTALIRICEKLSIGQKLLLVVTASPRRDPRLVVGTLERCGFEISALDLRELPYSLSKRGIGFVRTFYDTLMLEAVKMCEPEPRAFELALDPLNLPEIGQAELLSWQSLPWQRQRPFALSSKQWASVQKALTLGSYGHCREAVAQEIGEPACEQVLTYLLSTGSLLLTTNV